MLTEDRKDYLCAESFVIDIRPYGDKEWQDMQATMADLKLLALDKAPCEKLVLHAIVRDEEDVERVVSYFVYEGAMYDKLFENPNFSSRWHKKYDTDPMFKDRVEGFAYICYAILLVLLATRSIQKERREVPYRRLITNATKPHKKGTGGYTIVRAPTHKENGGAETGEHKRPHFRRGHIRKLHPTDKTNWIWVSPCFINGEPEVQRKAYLIKSAA